MIREDDRSFHSLLKKQVAPAIQVDEMVLANLMQFRGRQQYTSAVHCSEVLSGPNHAIRECKILTYPTSWGMQAEYEDNEQEQIKDGEDKEKRENFENNDEETPRDKDNNDDDANGNNFGGPTDTSSFSTSNTSLHQMANPNSHCCQCGVLMPVFINKYENECS